MFPCTNKSLRSFQVYLCLSQRSSVNLAKTLRLRPFPIVYITSNGSRKSHYRIEPTQRTLPDIAREAGIDHDLSNEPPRFIAKPELAVDDVQIEVSDQADVGAKVGSIEGTFGGHLYSYKSARISKVKTHNFEREERDFGRIKDAAQESWQHILEHALKASMRGDCVMFGVVTAAYEGRSEILGVKSADLRSSISLGSESLTCSAFGSDWQKKDIGSGGRKILGVEMMCFVLLKNYDYRDYLPDIPNAVADLAKPWFLSDRVKVSSWDTDLFKDLLQFCQNRDTWWKGWDRKRRCQRLMETSMVQHKDLAYSISLMSPKQRRRRYQKSGEAIGSIGGSGATRTSVASSALIPNIRTTIDCRGSYDETVCRHSLRAQSKVAQPLLMLLSCCRFGQRIRIIAALATSIQRTGSLCFVHDSNKHVESVNTGTWRSMS